MKKILTVLSLLTLTACGNADLSLGNYQYNYVTCPSLNLDNAPITSWKDYEDGTLEFKTGGNSILTHSITCTLSREVLK